MKDLKLLDLEPGQLFNLPVEDRKKVIEIGVDLLIEQVLLLSYKQNKTFIKVTTRHFNRR
jgi:hypothetical protein